MPKETKPTPTPSPLSARALTRTELGCMLGAFRDVAHSIGLQVVHVKLRQTNEEAPPRTQPPSLPKGKSRRDKKVIALVQTFADNARAVGFVLLGVDFRPVEVATRDEGKKWALALTVEN